MPQHRQFRRLNLVSLILLSDLMLKYFDVVFFSILNPVSSNSFIFLEAFTVLVRLRLTNIHFCRAHLICASNAKKSFFPSTPYLFFYIFKKNHQGISDLDAKFLWLSNIDLHSNTSFFIFYVLFTLCKFNFFFSFNSHNDLLWTHVGNEWSIQHQIFTEILRYLHGFM